MPGIHFPETLQTVLELCNLLHSGLFTSIPMPHLSFITTWNRVTLNHKHKPHLPIYVFLQLFYSFKNYYLILLTPLVSLHLEFSKHT